MNTTNRAVAPKVDFVRRNGTIFRATVFISINAMSLVGRTLILFEI
ncbi:MAG: hypothetical protein LBH80_06915 [Prevotellaceae bacterium]|nr:hypothetical protein [Prevotellaceae bacterium]